MRELFDRVPASQDDLISLNVREDAQLVCGRVDGIPERFNHPAIALGQSFGGPDSFVSLILPDLQRILSGGLASGFRLLRRNGLFRAPHEPCFQGDTGQNDYGYGQKNWRQCPFFEPVHGESPEPTQNLTNWPPVIPKRSPKRSETAGVSPSLRNWVARGSRR